jgi:hypothetical protein
MWRWYIQFPSARQVLRNYGHSNMNRREFFQLEHADCALKLHMCKACDRIECDRIEWVYLKAIMMKLGFAPHFVETVMWGVRSVSFFILFNGSRTESFKPMRGICQEDPFTLPFSSCCWGFIFTVERCYVFWGDDRHLGWTVPKVNHLLFVVDCILFCKPDEYDGTNMKECWRNIAMLKEKN